MTASLREAAQQAAEWVKRAYRNEGDEPSFTRHNMEVAFVAGVEVGRAALALPDAEPAPVERQPLTDRQAYDAVSATVDEPESFEDITSDTAAWAEVMEFIRDIEAAHGIK